MDPAKPFKIRIKGYGGFLAECRNAIDFLVSDLWYSQNGLFLKRPLGAKDKNRSWSISNKTKLEGFFLTFPMFIEIFLDFQK